MILENFKQTRQVLINNKPYIALGSASYPGVVVVSSPKKSTI